MQQMVVVAGNCAVVSREQLFIAARRIAAAGDRVLHCGAYN